MQASSRHRSAESARSRRSSIGRVGALILLLPLVSAVQVIPRLCQEAAAARASSCPCVHDHRAHDGVPTGVLKRAPCCELTTAPPVEGGPATLVRPGAHSVDAGSTRCPVAVEVLASELRRALAQGTDGIEDEAEWPPLYLRLRSILR